MCACVCIEEGETWALALVVLPGACPGREETVPGQHGDKCERVGEHISGEMGEAFGGS